jgi:non-canonical (house-cleaning) NTP pyrophosphatase
MGEICSTQSIYEKFIEKFVQKSRKEDNLKDLGMDRIILKLISMKEGVILCLSQDRIQRQSLVESVLDFRIPKKAGNL